jgi:hypothetical protein
MCGCQSGLVLTEVKTGPGLRGTLSIVRDRPATPARCHPERSEGSHNHDIDHAR